MQGENHAEEQQLKKEEVLALDIATHTGFYSVHGRGTWDFSESMRRNNNKQHQAFRETVMNFIQEHGIKQVVIEDVNCGRSGKEFKSSVKLSEFRGILFEICDTLNLPEPARVNPSTVKKWATGDGKADKAKMIKFCQTRWHTDPVDDNEADATHIYMYYVIKMKL